MQGATKKIIKFVTGNPNKMIEVKAIIESNLPGYEVEQIKIDLDELQGEPEDISRAKCIEAFSKTKETLIVEDTSLCFNHLKGLPGPYIKDFLTKLGTQGLYDLVANSEDKTAYAQCIFGVVGQDGEPRTFVGRTPGTIVEPRGPNNFGWDPVFQPDGFEETYAEMDKEVKNKISHRYRALEKVIEFLKTNENFN